VEGAHGRWVPGPPVSWCGNRRGEHGFAVIAGKSAAKGRGKY